MYNHSGDSGTSCMDVLQAIARLPDNADGAMIRDVVTPLVVDCDAPERVDDMTHELRAAIHDVEGFKRYCATEVQNALKTRP